jgi:protease-4
MGGNMVRRFLIGLSIWSLMPVVLLQAAPDDTANKKKDDKKGDVVKPRLAVFRLRSAVNEEVAEDMLDLGEPAVSLKDLVARLKKAKDDPAVKAVVLLHEGGSIGSAQTEELRQVMAHIRDAGKEVFTHADSVSMREYVLLSGASRISVVPTGDLWITGLYGESPYVRGLLDLLGVQPDFLTCGKYKSAAEIFMRHEPSPEADEMQQWLMTGIYKTYVKLIAAGRKVDEARAQSWIDSGPYTAEKAKAAGIIDAVEHRQEFEKMLKDKFGKDIVFDKKYGGKKQPTLDFSSPLAVFKLWGDMLSESQKKKSGKNAVAIVYVNGAIELGEGKFSLLGGGSGAFSTPIRKALDEAAADDSIKAVVLRVDSPGGSAVASEIILDATKRVKAKKPFVVSMGDVAGSGGYYVSCGADVIFADESTITGSIGVVSGKLVTTGMWKKVGINFKGYKRGEHADMLSSSEAFSKEDRKRMQDYMDEIYGVFKGHVEAIRGKKLTKPIDDLAGGRVYTGGQALALGLVDRIGTLQDAIEYVASEAKLKEKDYEIRVVPEKKNFLEKLIEESSGGKNEPHKLGLAARRIMVGEQINLIDLAMPYLNGLDPERVRLVKVALRRLQLIQKEGAVLMMPEMMLGR